MDVTELRRAEAAARQAAEFGERLIGIVSHDLRNPLNAIHLSVTKLLHSETLSGGMKRAAARVAKSMDRMKRMIAELLDFTRGAARRRHPHPPGAGRPSRGAAAGRGGAGGGLARALPEAEGGPGR